MIQNKLARWITNYLDKAEAVGFDAYKTNGELYDYAVTAINDRMVGLGLLDDTLGRLKSIKIRVVEREVYMDFVHNDPRIIVASLHLNEK